jgi:hypothetical protein
MSKRHTASRRRTYGRRQHELHERVDRRAERVRPDRSWGADRELEPPGYLDAPSTGQPYGFN